MKLKNRFSIINDLYKPKKITIKGNVYILTLDDNKKVVLKEKSDNVIRAYNYLKSRELYFYPTLLDKNRDNYFLYDYIEEDNIITEQKSLDLAKLIGLMHAKTSYFKDVDKSKYDTIYDDINNNLNYLKEYYSNLYDAVIFKEFYNPFENLFMDYYSKIDSAISFSLNELDKWHSIILNKDKQRVSLIHNNLDLSHFIKSDRDYIISFDKSKIDTPILDLVTFYKREYDRINFEEFFEKYLYSFNLNDDELKLFFTFISMPWEIKVTDNIFADTSNLSTMINYLNKTESLIRPYYSNDEKEE